MRASSLFLAVGLAACAGLFAVVGCSSDENGTGSATTQASTSTSGASSSGSGTSGSGSTSGSSGGTGGDDGYSSCGECTSGTDGAPATECKMQRTACDNDQGCTSIYDCVYGAPGCPSTDKVGACCTIKCYTDTGASPASVNLYKAFDSCVYCTTCKTLCTDPPAYDATAYCAAITAANPMCP